MHMINRASASPSTSSRLPSRPSLPATPFTARSLEWPLLGQDVGDGKILKARNDPAIGKIMEETFRSELQAPVPPYSDYPLPRNLYPTPEVPPPDFRMPGVASPETLWHPSPSDLPIPESFNCHTEGDSVIRWEGFHPASPNLLQM